MDLLTSPDLNECDKASQAASPATASTEITNIPLTFIEILSIAVYCNHSSFNERWQYQVPSVYDGVVSGRLTRHLSRQVRLPDGTETPSVPDRLKKAPG
jgi:hypothetical protein